MTMAIARAPREAGHQLLSTTSRDAKPSLRAALDVLHLGSPQKRGE
jgi:hypothetical protein